MRARPHFIAFYFRDFFTDSAVRMFNHSQIGNYLELMAFAWENDPPATIPRDLKALHRICSRMSWEDFEREIGPVLKCWSPCGKERLTQKRLKMEYEKARRLFISYQKR